MFRHRNTQFIVSLVMLVVCVVIVSMLASGKLRPFLIEQKSMFPTLHPNDYVMAVQYSDNGPGPQHGDIVILRDPESKSGKDYLVKRVIALPGDVFEVRRGGAVYINDQFVSEPYIREAPEYMISPVLIEDGHYVVLGDNRNDSEDSVRWGKAIPRSQIIGKVVFIYAPFSRMGRVR